MNISELQIVFQALMGINGDDYVEEISNTGKLCQTSYEMICDNIQYNSKESIIKHFGLVHYYYLQGKK